METMEEIEALIEANDIAYDEGFEQWLHSGSWSYVCERERDRLNRLKEFLALGLAIEHAGEGLVIVNNKIIVALRSLKWRNKSNTRTWYKARKVSDFRDKYT